MKTKKQLAKLLILATLFLPLAAQAEDLQSKKEKMHALKEEMRSKREEMKDLARDFRDEDGSGEEGRGFGPKDRGGRGSEHFGKLLGNISNFQTAVQEPAQAIGLAILGIKQYYKKSGKPEEAIKEIEELLKSCKNQKMRNIVLFNLRQIYQEQKNSEKFLEINRQIIKENLAAQQ